jgi:hypothetical protein
MPKKPGIKPKDSPISDNFNVAKKGNLSQAELKKAKREAKLERERQELANLEQQQALDRVQKRIDALKGVMEGKPLPEPEPQEPEGESDDLKSAYRMLKDLRYAFQNSKGRDGKKGRQRLVSMMETDAEFKFMIKELVRIETALLSAKIRTKEDPASQTNNMVFVILKGLEDEHKVMKQIEGIDMKQIDNALNPNAPPVYEADEQESMSIGGQAAPEGW